ncbi:porin family protein [Roseivirga sp. E12]|uniref:porin family protein n=1 Tax=Roseivirga sp. E12 TaxID=2819237 RepID=UPI001ABCBFB2|nr:porin family protein [Roseivirga sp. E12]MBO3698671.1 PorT family protein [Roseivirga sp. E12]
MKKLIIASMLMFTVLGANAQKINFGPRVALTSTTIDFKDPVTNFTEGDAQVGYQFGVFLRAKLLGLYIQPELLFSKTSSVLDVLGGGGGSVDFDFNKIDVPVMVGYKLGPIRLQVGPSFSFLTSAESTDAGGLVEDVKDNYNSATVGYQAGIGLDILKFVIDVKYEGNLTAFADALPAGVNSDQRQNQVVVAVGFKLF